MFTLLQSRLPDKLTDHIYQLPLATQQRCSNLLFPTGGNKYRESNGSINTDMIK
jgi:hypothetical protein